MNDRISLSWFIFLMARTMCPTLVVSALRSLLLFHMPCLVWSLGLPNFIDLSIFYTVFVLSSLRVHFSLQLYRDIMRHSSYC